MMFSLSFAVLIVFISGINGNTIERGYPFGKLRLAEEGKNEELIATINTEKSSLNHDQVSGVQPLPSPCIGTSPSTKLAYPKDKTKYIQCRDEFHYEIFTCPNGGEYNEQTTNCDFVAPILDRCEQEKPCFNDGYCILLSNSTYKCNCRADWTGDRCEIPINSCVNKPCGPNAECRTLKTTDYEQDYVCVCHATQSYGLNCQESVANPCLTISEQFFPYAFSQHVYIQCDGDLIHFQPCGPLLYWNQDEKICDRKRPGKTDLTALLAKLATKKNENNEENKKETVSEEVNLTGKSAETEQQNTLAQSTKENDKIFAFLPARIANRQQFQVNVNDQQGQFVQNLRETEQHSQQLSTQLSPSVESNQNRQVFISKAQQWPNHQVGSAMGHIPITQSEQNQLWSQNIQQQPPQVASSLAEASTVNSNLGQSKQDFPQQNQVFGSQQWLNQLPNVKKQNDQRFGSQLQSWQGSQTFQDQPQVHIDTTTVVPNIFRLQGFQNSNVQGEGQSWQNRPSTQSTGSNTQHIQSFVPQTQSWQSTQITQNQQPLIETTKTAQNIIPSQSFQNLNAQGEGQSWQNRPSTQSTGSNTQHIQSFVPQTQSWQNSQITQNQQPLIETTKTAQNIIPSQGFQNINAQTQDQSVGFNTQNTQNFASQPQSWQSSQFTQNQQPLVDTTTAVPTVISLQGFQNKNSRVQDQRSNIPSSGYQSTSFNAQNTQNFASQPLIETTTPTQNLVSLQSFQNSNVQAQDQPWQNKLNTQSTGYQPIDFNARNSQNFLPQTQSWQNKGNYQFRQKFVQPEASLIDIQQIPLNTDQSFSGQNQQLSSTNLKNNQVQNFPQQYQPFGSQQWLNQMPNVKTQNDQRFGSQSQSWQNKLNTQQIPNQGDKYQSNQIYAFKPKQWTEPSKETQINPSSQYGVNQQQEALSSQKNFDLLSQSNQLKGSNDLKIQTNPNFVAYPPLETSAIGNKDIQQGMFLQSSSNWQPSQTAEQQKTLDSIPTLSSGSWKTRS